LFGFVLGEAEPKFGFDWGGIPANKRVCFEGRPFGMSKFRLCFVILELLPPGRLLGVRRWVTLFLFYFPHSSFTLMHEHVPR